MVLTHGIVTPADSIHTPPRKAPDPIVMNLDFDEKDDRLPSSSPLASSPVEELVEDVHGQHEAIFEGLYGDLDLEEIQCSKEKIGM